MSAQDRDLEARMDRRIIVEESGGRIAGFIPNSRLPESALVHVQRQTSKPLFVNQVCINQEDPAEKNSLVKRMGEIYTKAERVLEWLGPATPELDATYLKLGLGIM